MLYGKKNTCKKDTTIIKFKRFIGKTNKNLNIYLKEIYAWNKKIIKMIIVK